MGKLAVRYYLALIVVRQGVDEPKGELFEFGLFQIRIQPPEE